MDVPLLLRGGSGFASLYWTFCCLLVLITIAGCCVDLPPDEKFKSTQATHNGNDKTQNDIARIEPLLENEKPIWNSIETCAVIPRDLEDRPSRLVLNLLGC